MIERAFTASGSAIRRSIRTLSSGLLFVLSISSFAIGQQRQEPARLIFLSPTRPVVIEAEFLTGRFSIDELRRQYATEVFKQLDTDQDGFLTDAEAQQIPVSGRLRKGAPRLEEKWNQVDIAPEDGRVSQEEFSEFLQSALGPPLSIERKANLAQSVRLYDDLDLNSDGRIDGDEVTQGLEILKALDFDDDETLSVAELQPFPLSVIQAQQESSTNNSPIALRFIRDTEEVEATVSALPEFYGLSEVVPRTMFPALSDREFERFDFNSDGNWDAVEIRKFLQVAPADYAMKVSLSPPRVEVFKGESDGTTRPVIDAGGVQVKWQARSNVHQRFDATRLYLVRFIMSDNDKNGYLSEAEFFGLQANVPFEEVDLDGNEQVTRDEIKFFFSMDGLAEQGRLVLTLFESTQNLFDILDVNADRRLNTREFVEGKERLLAFDMNQDGALLKDEFRTEFDVTFSQPEILERNPVNNQMEQSRQGRMVNDSSGPVWFRRMDDNLDGEISWREFLGGREKFDELDENGDNFLELSEAEAAESFQQQ
ncbi:hypothetical protein AB1L42_11670 [Thalassoglobus sp. JC818]|uniref:hypothetical protein n=1 Tax=Thalassoglobus sp. JC818 TaxID=3232136 RepID=UPI00345901A8